MVFRLTSPAFENGRPIPERHARRGGNLSPDLQWEDPPAGAQSFALVLEDVDAPPSARRHWVVYDISARARRHLPSGMSASGVAETLPQAINDLGNAGYDGPDPPAGDPPHTYRFRLFALAVPSLGFGPRPRAGDVVEALRERVLAEAELTGTYHG